MHVFAERLPPTPHLHRQAEVAFIEAEAAVAAIKRRGFEVVPPMKEVCSGALQLLQPQAVRVLPPMCEGVRAWAAYPGGDVLPPIHICM